MTVPSNVLKNRYTGNNVQTAFPYQFKIFNADQVLVKKIVGTAETTLVRNVDYTVNGVGNDTGGNIIYPISGSPLSPSEDILIKPNFEYVQNTKLENQNTFPPKTIENALDTLTMQVKQVAEELDRAVQLADGYDGDANALLAQINGAAASSAAAVSAAATATTQAGIATTKAAEAAASAAGLGIPAASLADALKSIRVKSDGTGYEFFTPSGGGTGTLKDMNIGQGVENDGSSNLRVKLDGATIARGSAGIKVADAGIGDTQLSNTGVTAGTYTNVTATVNAKGRVTSMSSGSAGLTSVSQGNLNTTTGTVSANGTTGAAVTLPGGDYGFFPQIKGDSVGTGGMAIFWSGSSSYTTGLFLYEIDIPSPAVIGSTQKSLGANSGGSGLTCTARQRYVTSSPPYALGEGIVSSFLFAMLDPSGNVVSHYFAEDPPWAYNGPTQTFADYFDPQTGHKYRLKRTKRKKTNALDILSGKDKAFIPDERSFDQKLQDRVFAAKVEALRGVSAKGRLEAELNFMQSEMPKIKKKILDEEYEYLSHDIKNADKDLIPHPFGSVPDGHTIVLVDCFSDKLADLMALQKSGGDDDVVQVILNHLKIDSDFIDGRESLNGVQHAKLRIK